MLIRATCLLLVLFTSPLATGAASRCCTAPTASEDCCESERSECPLLPGGGCSIEAASHVVATVAAPDLQPIQVAVPIQPAFDREARRERTPLAADLLLPPPRFERLSRLQI